MKKLISFAMAIAVVFVGLVCLKPRSFAAESGLLTYTVTYGKACITGTTGTITGDFTVPAEIDGYPVVEIGTRAFLNQKKITSITFSEGLEKIGDWPFMYANSLTSINLPSTVKSIGTNFSSSISSLKSISVSPDNPVYYSIDGILFKSGADGDTLVTHPIKRAVNYYIVPDFVVEIAEHAFFKSPIQYVSLQNTKTIGDYAFSESQLETIDFGSVEEIGGRAFASCLKIKSLDLTETSITSIDGYAFEWLRSLKDLKIGKSVKSIGQRAFSCCQVMENVEFDRSMVCTVDDGLFSSCFALQAVSFPKGVSFQNTGTQCFYNCKALESAVIPSGTIELDDWTFKGCTSIKSISLPATLATVEAQTFADTPLETVYFEGSELDWKYMTIGEGNEALQNATVYFDCKIYPDLSDEPADFSAVDEAIERANALDKSLYSDESVAALEKAVNSVDKTLTADKQSTVDDYVSAINAAIRGLKYRQADYYSVEAALDAASKVRREYCTEESLAALDSAVNAVEYGLDIRRQSEVSEYARAINAALAAIKYFDANYSAVDAAVAAAAKVDRSMWSDTSLARLDAAVNSVEYGLDITQQSTVDLFADSINRAIAELAYGDVTLRHDGHGVIVSATTKSLKKQTTLSVEMKDPASHEGSNFAVGGNIRSLNFYDITLFDGGEETQPKDAVTVKIRLRDGINPLKCRVYHVTDDPVDPLVRYANTLDGNYIVFETDHFSEFAVIEVEPTLSYIAVSSEPLKTNYALGDKFDPTGLRITAALSDGSSAEVTDYYLSAVDTSTLGKKSVRVYYTKDEVTKMTAFDITVSLPEGTVTVTNAAILGADTLAYGNSTRLTLGTNDGANSYSVKWSSSDPSVAAVDANGNVTAKGRGSVTIKAEITNLDGTTVTAEKKLACTMTFWQRVVAFFKGLFGKTKNIYFA